MCQIYASAQEAVSEEDVGMIVRSQWGPYKADYDEDAAPSHRGRDSVLGWRLGSHGAFFPRLLYNVQCRTLLYCAVHCVTPPAAVLIL